MGTHIHQAVRSTASPAGWAFQGGIRRDNSLLPPKDRTELQGEKEFHYEISLAVHKSIMWKGHKNKDQLSQIRVPAWPAFS